MFQNIYRRVTAPLYAYLALRKHGGVWGLKSYLAQQPVPDERLLQIYEAELGKCGSRIGCNAVCAGEPFFSHGMYGVFISGGARIGKHAVIFQQVTIGSSTLHDSKNAGSPTLGDNVYI